MHTYYSMLLPIKRNFISSVVMSHQAPLYLLFNLYNETFRRSSIIYTENTLRTLDSKTGQRCHISSKITTRKHTQSQMREQHILLSEIHHACTEYNGDSSVKSHSGGLHQRKNYSFVSSLNSRPGFSSKRSMKSTSNNPISQL